MHFQGVLLTRNAATGYFVQSKDKYWFIESFSKDTDGGWGYVGRQASRIIQDSCVAVCEYAAFYTSE
jgi:hypothetical protein